MFKGSFRCGGFYRRLLQQLLRLHFDHSVVMVRRFQMSAMAEILSVEVGVVLHSHQYHSELRLDLNTETVG